MADFFAKNEKKTPQKMRPFPKNEKNCREKSGCNKFVKQIEQHFLKEIF